jgi:opacity protein-like surface antigen
MIKRNPALFWIYSFLEVLRMKKVLIILALAMSATLAFAASASAAPDVPKTTNSKPFDGTFNGKIYGDKGTSAPISLVLTHKGSEVEGNVFIGEGLYIDGGMCGAGYIPAASQSATGQSSAKNPRHLSANSIFKVSGVNVKLNLNGDLSANGEQLKANATIDLPWFCGGDPVITGTLYKS